MKISLNWLKDYIGIKVPPEDLANRLTMAGLEAVKIHSVGGDVVFELEITPNRPDCLSITGIAREVSAISNKPRKTIKMGKLKIPREKCPIEIVDKKGCLLYNGTLVQDVHIEDAPDWIKKRITALGIRPINNIVDITNFCLMETGQPLHAFDHDKLHGGKIIVRRAKQGEKIVTIDDVERKLDESILVIADNKQPVAIAGIMGGKETVVTGKTKNILLESAYFDPIFIRRASRKLGLSSDSSYRFERGVDYAGVETGADRALSLILKHAGGKIIKRSGILAGKINKLNQSINLSIDDINTYLGTKISPSQCQTVLKRLDFSVSSQKGRLKATVPSFRNDIRHPVDIMEEIARVIGYDKLPSSLPVIKTTSILPDKKRLIKQKIRDVLVAQGFNEIISYTMTDQKSLDKCKLGKSYEALKITNPLTGEQEMMRPDILPSLMQVLLHNLNCGQKDIRFFEIGKNYLPEGEKEVLALIACGHHENDWRSPQKREIDFFDLKGALVEILGSLSISEIQFQNTDCFLFEAGTQAEAVTKNNENIAAIGSVSRDILSAWDIKSKNVVVAFLYLDRVFESAKFTKRFIPSSEFPAIVRDVSLAIGKDLNFSQIEQVALRLGGGLLKEVKLNEEYLGEKIPANQRGLIFSLVYQSADKTLRDEDVNPVHARILKSYAEELKATIR